MTKRVVGETIQEDTTTTHTREESVAHLTNAKRKRDRLNQQLQNHRDVIAQLDTEIAEWETAIAALPPLPAPPPPPPNPEVPPT